MKNEMNREPLTSAEYFKLMRLLQHLENEGEIPGSNETNWQDIYAKLNAACYDAHKREKASS